MSRPTTDNTQAQIEIQKADRGWVLTAALWLPRPRSEVFPFFADAFNLERLTPPLLRFHVLTSTPIEMQEGLKIDYRLKVRGMPMRWQSEIVLWDPPYCFVDEQRRGPYRRWHHRHSFEEQDAGTLCDDRVEYEVPGGSLVHRLFVESDVRRIFTFRQRVLQELFGEPSV